MDRVLNFIRGLAFFVILFIIIEGLVPLGVHGNNKQTPSHPPGVLSSDVFPCSGCHEWMEPNIRKRALNFHQDIKIKGHGEQGRWCLDCHDAIDRDKLRLLDGEKIEFRTSYRLCGQCHGNIYRDWKEGIHGRRTGNWDGAKKYLLCTYCHNPHSPRFKPLAPLAAPLRPEETLRR